MTTLTTTPQAGWPANRTTDPGFDTAGLDAPRTRGVRSPGIRVDHLVVTAGGATVIDDVSLSIGAGELFAIAGLSGAGKSTLLEAVAGVRPPAGGTVQVTGGSAAAAPVGFVPQDDIVHRALPLATSLRYAARLRLPAGSGAAAVEAAVARVLRDLGLEAVAAVRVGDLSGGQRKRASIAMELLTHPDVILLDEPTSGLDPATAAEVMSILRSLSAAGTTVVVTTHHLAELDEVDRFAFLGAGGRVLFSGTADEARLALGSADLTELYRGRLTPRPAPPATHDPVALPSPQPGRTASRSSTRREPRPARSAGAVGRWWVLTRRSLALLAADPLTLAILFGSPALVITMMVVLFPAAGAEATWTASATIQLPFWTAFAAFFFGLTAGLLQIVPEAAIAARERRAGVSATVYVLSKLAALAPALVAVSVGMLVALHAFDRLPTVPGWSPAAVVLTVLLLAASALALGLLASALVRDSAQAALALPMLCFPQVLFAGAVVSVDDMAPVGRFLSNGMSTRWGFEGIGDSLGLGTKTTPVSVWAVLASMTVVLVGTTVLALRTRR
jgi:ABC-type multidrug transport system ATPase subunit